MGPKLYVFRCYLDSNEGDEFVLIVAENSRDAAAKFRNHQKDFPDNILLVGEVYGVGEDAE